MKKLDKKGFTMVQVTLTKVIIALIVLVALVTLVYVWQEEVTGGADSKKCKLEVVRVSQASKIPGIKDKYLTAYCPSNDWGIIKLEKDGDEAIRHLAIDLVEEMEDCWDKFGKGELNPIKGETNTQKTHCYVCTSFRMPEKLPVVKRALWAEFGKELNIVLRNNDNARKFLASTITPERISQRTYFAKEIVIDNNLIKADRIDYTFFPNFHLQPDKSYYLINTFVVNKKEFVTNALQEGAPINEYEVNSELMFVDETNFENVCTQLEN